MCVVEEVDSFGGVEDKEGLEKKGGLSLEVHMERLKKENRRVQVKRKWISPKFAEGEVICELIRNFGKNQSKLI